MSVTLPHPPILTGKSGEVVTQVRLADFLIEQICFVEKEDNRRLQEERVGVNELK